MNPAEDPFGRSPIASPDGTLQPQYPAPPIGGDWATAPKIVKNWARQLAMLGVAGYLFVGVVYSSQAHSALERVILILICGAMFALNAWLIWALRKGISAAWSVQLVVSGLGLLNCGIGTILHGYVLSQWFKPEVKAWFGV